MNSDREVEDRNLEMVGVLGTLASALSTVASFTERMYIEGEHEQYFNIQAGICAVSTVAFALLANYAIKRQGQSISNNRITY